MVKAKVERTNIKVFGKNGPSVVAWKFPKGRYSREAIKKLADRARLVLSRKQRTGEYNYKIEVALLYPEGWRVGKFTPVEQPVNLYRYRDYLHSDSGVDQDDPTHYKRFKIYVMPDYKPVAAGRASDNDCLYDCLVEAIPSRMSKLFPNPAKFKKALGLARSDKVPLVLIPKVEEMLGNFKLSISGDYTYQSPKDAPIEISIILVGDHFMLEQELVYEVKGVSTKERVPMIYEKDDDGYACNYDGEDDGELTIENFKKIKSKPRSSRYVLVKKNDDDKRPLCEVWKEFIDNADRLKKATNGQINMYKTGSIPKTAEKLFFDLNKTLSAENINDDEAQWISDATMGAMIWRDEYEGEAHKYDIVSQYPTIMTSPSFGIPVKRGTFVKLTKEELESKKFYDFGIYKAKIIGDSKFNKLFRFNPHDTYTHYDLTRAKELGLTISIDTESQFNALLYGSGTRANGNVVFNKFVTTLYDLKKSNIPYAKKILNCIWGVLSQKNVIPKRISKEKSYTFFHDTKLQSMYEADGYYHLKYTRANRFYETNFARIAPFILSRGRKMLSTIIEEHIDHIKRVHTDGFISTKKIDFCIEKKKTSSIDKPKLGTEMGDIKYEGYCKHCSLKLDTMTVVGNFTL